MRIPSSSQAKACGCIPSGIPRWTGGLPRCPPHALDRPSTGVPRAFHRRSTGVPQAFHRCSTAVPQALYIQVRSEGEWAFVCHALLGYACKTHSSSQVGLYWHSSVESKNGNNDSSKTATIAARGQVKATSCPPDPIFQCWVRVSLGRRAGQTGNKNGKRNSRNIETEGVRGIGPYCLCASFSGSRLCV